MGDSKPPENRLQVCLVQEPDGSLILNDYRQVAHKVVDSMIDKRIDDGHRMMGVAVVLVTKDEHGRTRILHDEMYEDAFAMSTGYNIANQSFAMYILDPDE